MDELCPYVRHVQEFRLWVSEQFKHKVIHCIFHMSLISKLGAKLSEAMHGSVIADLGTLPANQHGWTVSISLRQQKSGHPNLVFKWQGGGEMTWTKLEASPETISKLESILNETRNQIKKSQV